MITASCHCGAVRFEIADAPAEVTDCNCSVCRRYGTLWAYYRSDQVRLLGPAEATFAYSWDDRSLEFHHCRTCGCTTHWRGIIPARADRMGVNARLMEPEVLAAARVRRLDGAVTETYLD